MRKKSMIGVLTRKRVKKTDLQLVSTNSMVGIAGVCSIMLVDNVMRKEVGFLVDTGTTHNFINLPNTKWLGFQLKEVNTFKVEVAVGETMKG